MVFVADTDGVRRLYRRELQSLQAVPIAGTEDAVAPFFSPDGRRIGFFAGGKMKTLALASGAPVAVADVSTARGATWAPDDTIIYSPATDAGLWRIAATGGIYLPDPSVPP